VSDCRILNQGPGYTIAETRVASTLVPYGPAIREDGNENYGYVDLRGRPDLVKNIPEAQKSSGLFTLLRTIADPVSKLMSSGCECHAFENFSDPRRPRWTAGCYTDVMFQDAARNSNPSSLFDIAAYSLNGIEPPPEGTHTGYEFLIEPLKTFFGADNCFTVQMKALGHGKTKAEAWAAMNYALDALARSIARDRSASVDSVL
jgi:hypothetical protein